MFRQLTTVRVAVLVAVLVWLAQARNYGGVLCMRCTAMEGQFGFHSHPNNPGFSVC